MATPLAIMTNVGSLAAQSNLLMTGRAMNKNIAHLSSGLRISSSAEDPAGMAVSESMRAQLRGFKQAFRNANDAVSLLQVAESGYQSVSDILVRMREIAVEAASETLSDTERGFLDVEFQVLIGEIDRIANGVEYNGITLLDGTNATLTFQVGTRNGANDQIVATTDAVDATTLGVNADDVTTLATAQTAIDTLDAAIETLNTSRTNIGSAVSQLNLAVDHLSNTIESYGAAVGNIRDADMAEESAEFSKHQVLQQAGVAMLAQANALPNLALRLLS